MLNSLKKYWLLFWLFRKINFMELAAYKGDFFFWSIVNAGWTLFNYLFYGLILAVTGTIGSWSPWEVYLLLSIYSMIDAFTWGLMGPNMWAYTKEIFSGELSSYLVKPIDIQFLYMTNEANFNGIFRFGFGLIGTWWSLHQLGLNPTWWQISLAFAAIVASITVLYGIWFLLSTNAFWVERLDNINEVIPETRSFWQMPNSIYPGLIRQILTTMLPLGLVTTVPSQILLGSFAKNEVIYLFVYALIILMMGRAWLHFSIKRYSSTGG